MFIRFQFRSGVFGELVRDQLSRSDIGAVPPTAGGFLVESIKFPAAQALPLEVIGADEPNHLERVWVPLASGGGREVMRRRVVLVLPVAFQVRVLKDFIAGQGQPINFEVDVRLSVDLVHDTQGPRLRIGYHGIKPRGPENKAYEEQVGKELGTAVPPRTVPFDFTEKVLETVASIGAAATPQVCWAGATLSPDRQTLEFRLEVSQQAGGTHRISDWVGFYDQGIDDVRAGRDWAVAIDAGMLRAAVQAGARKDILEAGDFSLDSGPDVAWQPSWPGFRTTFSGELVDACVCLWGELDVDADITVDSHLSVAVPGGDATVQIDSWVKADPSDAEELCCAVTGALFWPVVGSIYLAQGKTGWGGMLLGVAGGPIGALITMAELFDPRPNARGKEDCTKDPNDEDHQICRYNISLNPAPNACDPSAATITLDATWGRPDALVLGGAVAQRTLAPPTLAIGQPTPFVWMPPPRSCRDTGATWSAKSNFEVRQTGGEYPLIVKGAVPVGPAAPIYRGRIADATKCPTVADVEISTVDWPYSNPNPAPVVVLTNVGARLVWVPPLPLLPQDRAREAEEELALWRAANCYIFQPDGWWWRGRGLYPPWLVDPPPEELFERHLWVIRAGRLPQGEVIVVKAGPEEELLAIGVADGRKGVELDIVHDGETLYLERQAGSAAEEGRGEPYEMSITQVALREVDALRLNSPAAGLARVAAGPQGGFDVLSDGARTRFHLDSAGFLAPAAQLGLRSRLTEAPPAEGVDASWEQSAERALTGARRQGLLADDQAVGAVRATGHWRRALVDVDDGGTLLVDTRLDRAAARYAQRAWVDGLLRLGKTFVRLDDDRSTVRVYRVRDSVTL